MDKYLFLGYGPISARLIKELISTNQHFEGVVYSERTKKPNSSQVRYINDWENVDLNCFDVVINSWRTLNGDLNTSRIEMLTDISQKASSFEAFVNLSSVAVYGECKIEVDEESSTTPINEYGQFKLEFEQLLKDIKIANLLNLRVSNVFGDSSFDDVLNRVYRSILRGEPLKLMDPSRITRDFIGVDQVVSYTLDLLGKGLFKYSSQFIDINIASGISLYLSEAVEVIEKIIGQNLLIDVVGLEPKVIFESRISNKKLRSLVSVQDFLPSDEIERYFRWLSNQ